MSSVQQSINLTNKERLFQDDIESANEWKSKPFKKTTALTSSLSTILEDEEQAALTKDKPEKCVDEDEDDGSEPELILNIKLEEGWEYERATEKDLARELSSDYKCYEYENLLKENNLYQSPKSRIRNRRGIEYTSKTSPRAMSIKAVRMISQSTGLGKSMYNDGCDIHSDQTEEDKTITNPEFMMYSPFVRRPVKRSVMLQTSANDVLRGKTFTVYAREINAKPRDNRESKIRKVKRHREEYNILSWKDRKTVPCRTKVINGGGTQNEVNNVSSITISDETIYSENKVVIGQATDINAYLQSPKPCLSDTSCSTESAAHATSGGEPEIKSSSVFQKEKISLAETVTILITRPRDINILTKGSHVSEKRVTLDMKKATKTTASGPSPYSELASSQTITSSPTPKKTTAAKCQTKAANLPVRVAEFICNPSETITALRGNSQKPQEKAFVNKNTSLVPQPPPLPATDAPWRSHITRIENKGNSGRLQGNKENDDETLAERKLAQTSFIKLQDQSTDDDISRRHSSRRVSVILSPTEDEQELIVSGIRPMPTQRPIPPIRSRRRKVQPIKKTNA